jgi:hypothetical protein
MKRTTTLAAAALLAALGACGQKDNVTSHSQPGNPQPKPLTGAPVTAPDGGNPVYTGKAPATPGGALAPGEGKTPPDSAGAGAPASSGPRP